MLDILIEFSKVSRTIRVDFFPVFITNSIVEVSDGDVATWAYVNAFTVEFIVLVVFTESQIFLTVPNKFAQSWSPWIEWEPVIFFKVDPR